MVTLGCTDETTGVAERPLDASTSAVNETDTQTSDNGSSSMDAQSQQRAIDLTFASEVLPMLLMQCGAGCHLREINASNNNEVGGNHFEVWEEDIQGSRTEVLHPSFSNLSAIEDSELLLHHNNGRFFETDDNKSVLREWLADVAQEDD